MNYLIKKRLEDEVWKSFCLKQQPKMQEKAFVKKRFENHPTLIMSDSDASFEEIHLNKNFDSESMHDFENFGVLELNDNGLLNDLQVMEQINKSAKENSIIVLKEDENKIDDVKINKEKTRQVEVLYNKTENKLPIKNKCFDKKIGDEKLKSFVDKTLSSIDEIRLNMDSVTIMPDGAEDAARRKKRAVEFSGRFSRMYLYQLARQINELQRISKSNSGNRSGRLMNFDCHQKIITTHQLISQSFQAYQNHLPTSVPNGIPDKLKELLNHGINLCDVHRNLINCDINLVGKRESMINMLENHCKTLLEKMQENAQASAVSINSQKSKYSLIGNKKSGTEKGFQRKMQSRLSMYNQSNRHKSELFIKKTISALAKKKFNVQSRYKTTTLKQRSKPVKSNIYNKQKDYKLSGRSSCTIKSSKSKNYNSDEVLTMIQMEDTNLPNNDNLHSNTEIFDIRQGILKPLTRNIFEQFCDENKDMTQAEFEKLLQKLLVLVRSNDQNNQIVQNNENNQFVIPETDLTKSTSCIDSLQNFKENEENKAKKCENEGKNGTKRKQTITVSGAKNAQLICIRDDDSIIDDVNDKEITTNELKTVVTCETQTSFLENSSKCTENDLVSKTNVKISRLPKKCLRNLQLLPKETALNIIEYKLDFNKINKKNHMYKKTAKIQPWILTGEIADNIFEEVLFSVIREVQINELLENLYQSEFL